MIEKLWKDCITMMPIDYYQNCYGLVQKVKTTV